MKAAIRSVNPPIVMILAAVIIPITTLFILVLSPESILPVSSYLMIPISAATLALGIVIARKGRSLTKYSSDESAGYVLGVMLFVIGSIVSLFGFIGVMWFFLPWD